MSDIARLRAQYRICGTLGGTLPHLAQQNVFLGVPLVLMPEEVVLLVEKGIAVLVDDINAYRPPTQPEKNVWNEAHGQDTLQSILAKRNNSTEVQMTMSEDAVTKRQQRAEKKAAQASPRPPTPEGRLRTRMPSENTQPSVLNPVTSTVACIRTIPTTSASLPWYNPSSKTFSTIAAAKQAGVWTFPDSPSERARYRIFCALWEKGYYLGCGTKFGGEFLVYPGDPLRYHSHYIASVLESHVSPLRPMEVVAHGRLSTATKKAHLVCSWDEVAQEADIYSIEWAGFG